MCTPCRAAVVPRRATCTAAPALGNAQASDAQAAGSLTGSVVVRRDARIGFGVGERQHHPRERDPVRDAVVHSHDQRRALAESVDHVVVPERPVAVERHRHEIADELLERALIARRRKRDVVHVVLEGEVRVVLPPGRPQVAAGSRPPAGETSDNDPPAVAG